jgi:hypothetical protein
MKRSRQAGEPRRQIFTPVDAQGAAATLREDLEISPGLRCFDNAEGVHLSGYRQVHGIVARDLEKSSAIRSTLCKPVPRSVVLLQATYLSPARQSSRLVFTAAAGGPR